jgi:hypothetical protein
MKIGIIFTKDDISLLKDISKKYGNITLYNFIKYASKN